MLFSIVVGVGRSKVNFAVLFILPTNQLLIRPCSNWILQHISLICLNNKPVNSSLEASPVKKRSADRGLVLTILAITVSSSAYTESSSRPINDIARRPQCILIFEYWLMINQMGTMSPDFLEFVHSKFQHNHPL